jgi:chemotaxis protein MotB
MAADKGARKVVIIKKKKVVAGGHHGGSWKVAYADFVTAMMAFFMVMWILGMDEKVKQAVEGYFANPIGYKKGYGAGSSPIASGQSPSKVTSAQIKMIVRTAEAQQMQKMATQIRQALAQSGELSRLGAKVEVVVTREGLRIELIETGSGEVFFPLGSTTMKPAAVIALQVIAPELRGLTNPVVLEGHTDANAFGTSRAYTNWELSSERANAARRVLESAGLPGIRLAEVRGYADRRLRNPGNARAAENRRISILLPYSSDAPVDEVQPAVAAAEPTRALDLAGTR